MGGVRTVTELNKLSFGSMKADGHWSGSRVVWGEYEGDLRSIADRGVP